MKRAHTRLGPAGHESSGEQTAGPVATFVVVAVLAAFAVWLLAQLLSLFASAEAMTGLRRIVAFALAWGSLALVAGLALWGAWLFRALPNVPKVYAADYDGRPADLKETLQKGYLAQIKDPAAYAARAGFAAPAADEIAARLQRLKSRETAATDDGYLDWTAAFRVFQSEQDERASEIINRCMGLIAVKTAASPWKIVDALAVFFNSAMMIFEIAKVYNRRATRFGAVRLAGHWAFNIYVASEMGPVAESGVNVVTGAAGHLMKPNGFSGALASSLPLVGKIASKAVEGGANALFARALGKRAIREFQAVAF